MELFRGLDRKGRKVLVFRVRKPARSAFEEAEALMRKADQTGRSSDYDSAFRAFRQLADESVTARRRLAEHLAADGERYVTGFREQNMLRPGDPAPSPRARELFEEAVGLDP